MLSVLLAFVVAGHDLGVGPNFLVGDRDQLFLLPPDMREWLPDGHLALFVIDVVEGLDLSRFIGRYRVDGRGGAAYAV